jgi:hypothetical protein
MQHNMCCLGLLGVWLGLMGCTTTVPEQPTDAQPYALLVLPESIRLVAVDTHTFDPRLPTKEVRLSPGLQSLRLAYVGTSLAHVGQQADPFRLEAQAGHKYVFEART